VQRILEAAFPEPTAAKVPEITAIFWVIKILTTAGGEATADYFAAHDLVVGAIIEALSLCVAACFQLRLRRYFAPAYWLFAYAIAIFGTSVSDVMHRSAGIPYELTSGFWILALAVVFWSWHSSEKTLSIHSILTRRRELFYWATVFATFALGTALGDLTAYTFHLGFLVSGLVFLALFVTPGIAWRLWRLNEVVAFWTAYVVTRPLGASFADYVSKAPTLRGLGFGDAPTSFVIAGAIAACVIYVSRVRNDIQGPSSDPELSAFGST
jgi:uncharacterized membrane-anchored protein